MLTIAAGLVFALCVALGVWQLQRFDWKEGQLTRIAAMQAAPPQPIGRVLASAARGEDVSFDRVFADCAAGSAPAGYRISSLAGEWVARPLAACRLAAPPYDGIAVDRGVLDASRGSTSAPTAVLPAPVHVEGVLRTLPAGPPVAGLARPAAYLLVAERETPPAPGATPAPATAQAPDNLQYAGAYAPTWFGLAGGVACVYAAMLWRRLRRRTSA